MPLSWTEIRDRATAFQKRWKDDTSEQAESQTFWTEFLNIYGVDRRKLGAHYTSSENILNWRAYTDPLP